MPYDFRDNRTNYEKEKEVREKRLSAYSEDIQKRTLEQSCELIRQLVEERQRQGMTQQEVADIIGLENYQALVDTFGGSQIWIPKARSLVSSPEISTYIRSRRQNGDTPEQIARELELPVSEVRRLSK